MVLSGLEGLLALGENGDASLIVRWRLCYHGFWFDNVVHYVWAVYENRGSRYTKLRCDREQVLLETHVLKATVVGGQISMQGTYNSLMRKDPM